MCKEWFATWFDTKYYHILYRNRNEVEAHQFIDALLRFLNPAPTAHFLDVACGKGRHAHYLRSKGFKITGVDLSENSIRIAKEGASNDAGIGFVQHDIREPFPINDADIALNLFTSFGYFDSNEEHLLALQNIANATSEGGLFVMDYLNVDEVLKNFACEDVQIIDGLAFHIKRYKEDGCIVKSIDVHDGNEIHHFEERVRSFTKGDLSALIQSAGYTISRIFGNYELMPYSIESPRVIIIAQKNP